MSTPRPCPVPGPALGSRRYVRDGPRNAEPHTAEHVDEDEFEAAKGECALDANRE